MSPEPILVVGAYGYRNAGDEAILAGLLRTLAGRRVTVVSRSPAETAALHGVCAIGLSGSVGALRRHRSVLIGGGGLFGRDMGRIGRLLPLYGLLAAALGRTVRIEGVGIDPDLTGIHRLLVRRLLQAAAQVSVRDGVSAAVVREWGFDVVASDDLSAHMPAAPAAIGRGLLRTAGVGEGRKVVGLCLTAVNDAITDRVSAAVLAAMRRHPEMEFCFIPMSQHPYLEGHNDLVLARRLQASWPGLRIVEGAHHPSALLSLFGSLDAVVGMRYHSLLFAERAGVPLVPLSYAAKSDAWLAERRLRAVPATVAGLSRALARILPARSRAS
ncbi:MAG: polysaccharide pyruvyl transferase family protein [Chloroflexota bacterium]